MSKRKFDQVGQLAIEPSALALDFECAPALGYEVHEGSAYVIVRGPLMSRKDIFFDGYDAIVSRVQAALESSAERVVLCIDSPGGLVSGCLAASRQIRRAALAAGKPLIAYVDESATSAAYALACAADQIVVPPTGRVGSIGVIEVLPSFARQASAAGVDVTVLTSGERKGDGNPALLMTDDARAALQLGVDRMAEAFFELVEEHRPALRGKVAALQAAIYYGVDAIAIGLADRMMDLDQLKAALAAPQQPEKDHTMTRAEIKAGLKALAEGSGEDAEAAKRMLAADDAPPAEDEEKEEKPEASAAAPPFEKKDEEEKEEEPKAAASVASAIAPLAQAVNSLATKIDAREKSEREAMIKARPDVSPALFAAMASASNEALRSALDAIPLPNHAATVGLTGTRGEGQGESDRASVSQDPEQAARMDLAMGLAGRERGAKFENGVLQLGVLVPTKKGV